MTTLEFNIDVECNECSRMLKARAVSSRHGAVTLYVDPCEKCVGDANSDGFREGQESVEEES